MMGEWFMLLALKCFFVLLATLFAVIVAGVVWIFFDDDAGMPEEMLGDYQFIAGYLKALLLVLVGVAWVLSVIGILLGGGF